MYTASNMGDGVWSVGCYRDSGRFEASDQRSSEEIKAESLFSEFLKAESCSDIQESFEALKRHVTTGAAENSDRRDLYSALKSSVISPKARELWGKLDARASHVDYKNGDACKGTNILVIGAGPCGLRFAVEAALLGAKVVVLDKRSEFTRNNVLHLWPYVITDLKNIGAKIFYPKFSVGGIDHISIRRLQIILLKIALMLGVEVVTGTSFEGLREPAHEEDGWRVAVCPEDSPVAQLTFDVIIGAEGKRNSLSGFNRKEFRGKLAIAITFNFVNHRTREEARIAEVGGISSFYFQKMFRELREKRGIDLENFVYFKSETHYFVMTASKESLVNKGVLLKNCNTSAELLSAENTDEDRLLQYALEAAKFVTGLPNTEFVIDLKGKEDIAMFDFTSMFTAKNSCRAVQRKGKTLLMGLVGDSLLEPFWPTGTGCARGFLGVFDAAWMIRRHVTGELSLLEAMAERESLFQLLPQTGPATLHAQFNDYSLNPNTRYKSRHCEKSTTGTSQVKHLLDRDSEKSSLADDSCDRDLSENANTCETRLANTTHADVSTAEDVSTVEVVSTAKYASPQKEGVFISEEDLSTAEEDLSAAEEDLYPEGDPTTARDLHVAEGVSSAEEDLPAADDISIAKDASSVGDVSATEDLSTTGEDVSAAEVMSTPANTSSAEDASTLEHMSTTEYLSAAETETSSELTSTSENLYSVEEDVSTTEHVSTEEDVFTVEEVSRAEKGVFTAKDLSTVEDASITKGFFPHSSNMKSEETNFDPRLGLQDTLPENSSQSSDTSRIKLRFLLCGHGYGCGPACGH